MSPPPHRSPATRLMLGLIVTLAAVATYSWTVTREISGLRALQTDLADRNRQDSLQLLRIQNDLNALGLAMRDMLDGDQPYPLTAWAAQFQRIRRDLDDALQRQEQVSVARRTPDQQRYLQSSVDQFWDAADRIFALARDGHEGEARGQIRVSLQARQAALGTAVAQLLAGNYESEERTAEQAGAIYTEVQRQAYLLLAATLVTIAVTGAYLIHSNRRLFAELASLSDERRALAQQLIATRESTLREIARELHDEFGQVLTAIGSMLHRADRQLPDSSPLHDDLREIQGVAQATLSNVRGLSQSLHPSILDELGLDSALDWYVPTAEKQLGLQVSYERTRTLPAVDAAVGIHVYRVLQEALSNVARHAGTDRAWVRLRFTSTDGDGRDRTARGTLELEVEDHGRGLGTSRRRGLGIVTMRERADMVGGTLELRSPAAGGTLVRLTVPVEGATDATPSAPTAAAADRS